MSLVLNDLFTDMSDFKEVVPSIGASVDLEKLNSSAMSARKQIQNIITKAIYDTIKEDTDTESVLALKQALANATMAKQVVFDAIEYRKSDTAVYKNELELMKRSYMDNYYNAMDTLLVLLKDDEVWKETAFCKKQDELKIKSAEDFNLLYPIDNSYLFYFRTIPIQAEIIDEDFCDLFEIAAEKQDTKSTNRLMRSLALMVVATAIKRFDPLELPMTIRNLFEDTTASRSGDSEQSRLLNLAKDLQLIAMDTIKNVIDILTITNTTTSIDTESSFTLPEDQIILLG